ncbi:MAG TPA: hypothetical protein VMH23_00130 [Bacteroidota bacterium]|nr:hypothetical protein [Bacteroidota bacterium]
MNKAERINNEVRRTMDLLDKMPRLETNPFIFTRIQARLNEEVSGRSRSTGMAWTMIRFALLALLIVSNVATVVESFKSPASTTYSRKQLLSSIIDDDSSTGSNSTPTE